MKQIILNGKKPPGIGWKLYVLLLLLVALLPQLAEGQNVGDYRSAQDGAWNSLSSWERYNGSTWATPTSGQGYPGQNTGTGAVSIIDGDSIELNVSVTNSFTSLTITGSTVNNRSTMYLTGNTNRTFNTLEINIVSYGQIYFGTQNPALNLPANASLVVFNGGRLWDDGTGGGNCSGSQRITVGGSTWATCGGGAGEFTFADLNASGGSVTALMTNNGPLCSGSQINLSLSYSGAVGKTTSGGSVTGVSYVLTEGTTTVQSGTMTPTSQTASYSVVKNTAGSYVYTLTVTTYVNTTAYTQSETQTVVVNPLPTLSGASQAAMVCAGSQATINLTGLRASTTHTVSYTINGGSTLTATGMTSNASGAASFQSANLTAANNGQTLQITGLSITSATPNCTASFTQNVTLSVQTDTWLGTTSTDWFTAANWCDGVVPTSVTEVVIPSTATFQPQINGSGAVCGSIDIKSGASLTFMGSYNLDVYGNWTNNGTFTPSTGTVSFRGGLGQSILTGTTFNNLTINKSALAVTLSGVDATVNGTLTFTSGLITTGSNYVIMGDAASVSRTSGHVNGNVRRYIPNGTSPSVTFPIGDATSYAPATLAFSGTVTGSGYIDASTAVIGAAPPAASGISQTKYVNRKWTLNNTGVGGFTDYNSTFYFVSGDLVGTPNTSTFIMSRYTGSTYQALTVGTRTSSSTQATGVTDFGIFYIGETGITCIRINNGSYSRQLQ